MIQDIAGVRVERIDLAVFEQIRLIVDGEACPHCHGSGKRPLQTFVVKCPFCVAGVVPPNAADEEKYA